MPARGARGENWAAKVGAGGEPAPHAARGSSVRSASPGRHHPTVAITPLASMPAAVPGASPSNTCWGEPRVAFVPSAAFSSKATTQSESRVGAVARRHVLVLAAAR